MRIRSAGQGASRGGNKTLAPHGSGHDRLAPGIGREVDFVGNKHPARAVDNHMRLSKIDADDVHNGGRSTPYCANDVPDAADYRNHHAGQDSLILGLGKNALTGFEDTPWAVHDGETSVNCVPRVPHVSMWFSSDQRILVAGLSTETNLPQTLLEPQHEMHHQ